MPKVVIYMKPTCLFCVRAISLLQQKSVDDLEIIDISGNDSLRSEMIDKASGGKTVPQIFIDTKHIGGCDDLFALDSQGGLDPLLAA